MKYFFIGCVKVYQMIPGPWHDQCRHIPSCSNYSIEALKRYGAWKGFYLTVKRICKCNPFGTFGYDPVPLRRK